MNAPADGSIGGLFEGYGGLTTGVRSVLGGDLAWYSEIDPAASRVLAHHDPGVPNLGDITRVGLSYSDDEWGAMKRRAEEDDEYEMPSPDWSAVRPVRVLTGGFPCFPAGTLVDAGEDGFRAIETLRIGDLVLTHARRRRRVTSVMRRLADDVLTIKAMGSPPFRATAEHPFYVRRRQPGRTRIWGAPEWVDAGLLRKGDMLAMPLDDAGAESVLGPALAYLVGRWLGDGWIVDHPRTSLIPVGQRGSRVTSRVHKAMICAAHDEGDEVAKAISAAGFHATPSRERTVTKFHISSQELVKTLRQFGRGAAGKRLPGWVFTAPQEERAALLRGWLDADGSQQASGAWRGTTVSEELAHGMARLARNVHGVATSVHRFEVADRTTVEGREVRQRPQFQVVIPPHNRESFIADGYAWVPIRSIAEAAPCEVFNVSVEEDESYTAWGYAVHNCQDVSAAGKRAGMKPGTRSGLWTHMAYAISQLRPRLVVVENVRGLLSAEAHCDVERCPWCLGDERDIVLRALGAVLADLAELGYDAVWCGLRASDVGAPHQRFRVFVAAADADASRWGAGIAQHGSGQPDAAGSRGDAAADTDSIGSVRGGGSRGRRTGSPNHDLVPSDTASTGRGRPRGIASEQTQGAEPEAIRPVGRGSSAPAADTDRGRLARNPERDLGQEEGLEAPLGADAVGRVLEWGDFEPAIRRWEGILGRRAAAPTVIGARGGRVLNPAFVEWMMGLPAGHVTGVEGLSRNDQLKILGNGVVPQQAAAAVRYLLPLLLSRTAPLRDAA